MKKSLLVSEYIITNNIKENVLNKPLCTKVETVQPKFLENLKKFIETTTNNFSGNYYETIKNEENIRNDENKLFLRLYSKTKIIFFINNK